MRSAGEELQPSSLRDVIVSIKHEIQQSQQIIAVSNERKQAASQRWRIAYTKQGQLRKTLWTLDERRQRAEAKLEAAEKRLDLLSKSRRITEENRTKCKYDAEELKRNEELVSKGIELARKFNVDMMQELSAKLALLSQRGYHHRFVDEKCEADRLKIFDLEEQLVFMKKRFAHFTSQAEENRRARKVKTSAMMEQIEDDMEVARKRAARAKNKILKLEIDVNNLSSELEWHRDRRIDVIDQLENAKRIVENEARKIYSHNPVQYYR